MRGPHQAQYLKLPNNQVPHETHIHHEIAEEYLDCFMYVGNYGNVTSHLNFLKDLQ